MTRTHREVGAYYDQKPVAQTGVAGAGLIWFMGRDHLSPSLSNNDAIALHSNRWREGASARVLHLAKRVGLRRGDMALDLGCGIGGPSRDVALATGASVCGISISIEQLKTSRALSEQVQARQDPLVKADMQRLPFRTGSIDGAYSINAIYHVNAPEAVIGEAHRVLREGRRFGVDDWFTTDAAPPETIARLRHNWSTGGNGFHNFNQFVQTMEDHGFKIDEVIDYTEEAGAFLSEGRFGATYDSQIAPVLEEVFPQLYQYDGYEPAHAAMAVQQLRSDILYMGQLYRNGEAVYRQIIGEKLLTV